MLTTLIDYLTTVAERSWLTPLSVIAKTIAAVISLYVAVHRAVRYARRVRQRDRKSSCRPRSSGDD